MPGRPQTSFNMGKASFLVPRPPKRQSETDLPTSDNKENGFFNNTHLKRLSDNMDKRHGHQKAANCCNYRSQPNVIENRAMIATPASF